MFGNKKSLSSHTTGFALLLFLLLSYGGCRKDNSAQGNRSKEEIQKHEEQRARNLEESFKTEPKEVQQLEDESKKKLQLLQQKADLFPEWKHYRDQLTRCVELNSEILKAASEKRYQDVLPMAIQGLVAADTLAHELLNKSEETMKTAH